MGGREGGTKGRREGGVVISRAFCFVFPCNHIMNIKKHLFPVK